MGGDIQVTDEDGSNGAGPWDAVKMSVTDCATLLEWQLCGDGRNAEGDGGVTP